MKSFMKRCQVLRVLRAPLPNYKACCGGLNKLAAFNTKPPSSQSFLSPSNGTVADNSPSFIAWSQISSSLHADLNQFAADNDKDGFISYLQDFGSSDMKAAQHNAAWINARRQCGQSQGIAIGCQIRFNFDDAVSFWKQFEEYVIPETGRLYEPDIVEPLTFYRNCTSAFCNIPFQGREKAINKFKAEVDRKIKIVKKEEAPKHRETVTATFGGPGSGKSRLIDQFAIDINDNYADSKEIFPICLNVTYNQRTQPYWNFDNNSDPNIAFSAFCWRILCNFCESVNESVIIGRVYEKIVNHAELTLNTTIKLILNHPSIKNNIKHKIPLIYIALDEILNINQKLDGFIIDRKGNQIDFHNSYNIIRRICSYYDELYSCRHVQSQSQSNNELPAVIFAVSSLYRGGFKDGNFFLDREIINLPLHRISNEQCLNMIEYVLGKKWRDHIEENMYSVLLLCDGYPFVIDAVIGFIREQISNENLTISKDRIHINSLKYKIFSAMIERARKRSYPSDYNILFKEPSDFYRFLSYDNVKPIDELTDSVIAQYKESDALNEILSSSHLEVVDQQFVIPCFILYYIYKTNPSFQMQQIFGDLFDLLGETTKIRMSERFLAIYEVFHCQIMCQRYSSNYITLNEYFSNCNPLISDNFKHAFNNNKYDISKICKFDPSVREVGYDDIEYNLDTIYWSNYDGTRLFDYGSRVELIKKNKDNINGKNGKQIWFFRQVTTDRNSSRATTSKFKKFNEKVSINKWINYSKQDVSCYFVTHSDQKVKHMPNNSILLFSSHFEKWIVPSFKFWWVKLKELPAK